MKIKHKNLQNIREWHEWFAWYPIRINDSEIIWMEKVVRRFNSSLLEHRHSKIKDYGDFNRIFFERGWEYKESILDLIGKK